MTHLVELPENVERVLEQKARQRGVALDAYLLELAVRDAQDAAQKEAVRREAVRAARGMLAHCGPTPEERRRWKDEEIQREMDKDEEFLGRAKVAGNILSDEVTS